MYQSLEAIEKLREEKIKILKSVYSEMNIKAIYQKQKMLNSMAINIYSDATSAIADALIRDGAGKRILPRISGRLDELRFTSVPAESVIDEAYKQSIMGSENSENNQYSFETVNRREPRAAQGSVINIKSKSFPLLLAWLIAQGIIVPILINGASVLVKVLALSANGALMSVEVVKYYQYQKKKVERANAQREQKQNAERVTDSDAARDDMKRQAIFRVYSDNLESLNRWFDNFAEITRQEIERELAKKEDKQ